MKFGKSLQKVISFSPDEWAPFFINYKLLKKQIKDIAGSSPPPAVAAPGVRGGMQTPAELIQDAREIAFFRLMHAEVQKTSEFFVGMEQQMALRKKRIKQGIAYVKHTVPASDIEARHRIRRACVSFYKDLLLLENFAIINYTGYSKAAKKHDKNTGFLTRARFMKNVVNKQPFTHYPGLLEMITEMEQLFTEMEQEGRAPNATSKDEEDERRAIEAIRIMKEEASTLQREERVELASVESAGIVRRRADSIGSDSTARSSEDGDWGADVSDKRRRLEGPVAVPLAPQHELVA